MKSADDLRQLLQNIDRKSYPAYKGTKGVYRFGKYALGIDHVQGDPFAAPSSLHIEVSGKVAAFPERLYDETWKRIALEDYLIRQFGAAIGKYSFQAKGSGKSGIISVTRCGQEILKRSACEINPANGNISMRFEAGFPANGRTINARELDKLLFDLLPRCVQQAYGSFGPMVNGWNGEKTRERLYEMANDTRRKAAQLMIIAGCDDGTMDMPNWSKNFRFAAGMQDAIESRYPSLTRPVFFCYRKYNQDLTTGSLLIEIGSPGNTLEEVLYTAQLAGDAIGSYLQGLTAEGE